MNGHRATASIYCHRGIGSRGGLVLAASLLLLANYPYYVDGHSWLECTNYSLSTGQCSGYQRGWSINHINTDMTYHILDQVNVPVCFPGQENSSK